MRRLLPVFAKRSFGQRAFLSDAVLPTPAQHRANDNAPLIEHFRSSWPDVDYHAKVDPETQLLPRTVPDSALRFHFTSTFHTGSSLHYPHLQMHPADCKVRLHVSMKDLPLSDEEKQVVVRIVGPRYNPGKKEFKLVSDRFPNRIENRKYLTLLLEQILAEAKALNLQRGNFPEPDLYPVRELAPDEPEEEVEEDIY